MHAEIDSPPPPTPKKQGVKVIPYLNENSGNGGFYLLPVNAQGGQ